MRTFRKASTSKTKRWLVAMAALALPMAGLSVWVGVASVPAAAQEGTAATAEGTIVDFSLEPSTQTITVGEPVRWVNDGAQPHTVTDRGGSFDTGVVQAGEEATITPDVPGTYSIFCEINPGSMNAEIVVLPSDETPDAVRIQALDEGRDTEKRFDPVELEVTTGTEVFLANVGGFPHSLVAEDGSFEIPVIEPGAEQGRFSGGSDSIVADRPGRYAFFCGVHPAVMRGVLTVVDPEEPPPDVEGTAAAAEESSDSGSGGGTVFAYLVGAMVVGVGVLGLVLMRQRTPDSGS